MQIFTATTFLFREEAKMLGTAEFAIYSTNSGYELIDGLAEQIFVKVCSLCQNISTLFAEPGR